MWNDTLLDTPCYMNHVIEFYSFYNVLLSYLYNNGTATKQKDNRCDSHFISIARCWSAGRKGAQRGRAACPRSRSMQMAQPFRC